MANSYIEVSTSGSSYVLPASFNYLDINDINALGKESNGTFTVLTVSSRDADNRTIVLSGTPSQSTVRFYRATTQDPLVDFTDGARLTEADLDKAYRQGLFAAQEVAEDAQGVGNLSTTNLTLNGTTTVTNLNVTGTVTGISNTPAFLAKMSGIQTLTDATDTKVAFDTEVFDTDSKYDHSTNYRFTPAVAGTYFLYANVLALSKNNTELVDFIISIRKNGSAIYSVRHNPSNNYANQISLNIQVADVANTTDYYEVFVYIDDLSGNPDIDNDLGTGFGVASYFGAYKLIGA